MDLRNPRTEQRLWLGVMVLGGAVAGVGVWLRDRNAGGNDQWTLLLDTVGLVVALAGAILDFRTTLKYGDYDLAASKRRGALLLLVGMVAGLGGCLLVGWVMDEDSPAVFRGIMSGAMTTGIAAGIGGLLHIGWFGSGDHIERRIGQRSDEEW